MNIPNHLQKTAFFQLLLQAAVAFFIINCSVPPVHAAIDKDCDPGIIVSVRPPLKANGKFKVYVEKEIMSLKVWQKVGIVECDNFMRTTDLDLASHVVNGQVLKVRLKPVGGHAAHIDAVLMGDTLPAEATGNGNKNLLKKISALDNDVADIFGKTVELVFPETNAPVLTLTARIEGKDISKVPFHFPPENTYKPITRDSKFYTVHLKAGQASDTEASLQATIDDGKPLFRELSVPGTGHPIGYTYGWAAHDDKYLYVAMDFTGDNTRDGLKDYAAVYVKTGGAVKEFKVSEGNTQWGFHHFTYTKRVTYQHKFYTFKIPFKEIGINSAGKSGKIQLAFAAYGTCSPTTNHNTVAFGDVAVGSTSSGATIKLTHNSGGAFTVLNPIGSNSGGDTDQFSVANIDCPGTLTAVQSCTFNLFFSPTSAGAKSTDFVIDPPGDPCIISIALSGTGTIVIPTLNQWGIIFLTLAAVFIGVRSMRRNRLGT